MTLCPGLDDDYNNHNSDAKKKKFISVQCSSFTALHKFHRPSDSYLTTGIFAILSRICDRIPALGQNLFSINDKPLAHYTRLLATARVSCVQSPKFRNRQGKKVKNQSALFNSFARYCLYRTIPTGLARLSPGMKRFKSRKTS